MTTREKLFGTRDHPARLEGMAAAVGVHRTTLGRYRNDIPRIPWGTLKKIIRYQGLDKDDVWKMVMERD